MNELNTMQKFRRGLSFSQAGRRAVLAGVLAGALTLGMAGCASTTPQTGQGADAAAESAQTQPSEGNGSSSSTANSDVRANVAGMDFEYSDRDLAGTYDEATAVKVDLSTGAIDGEGVAYDQASGTFTVSQEGVYMFSGTLAQGQIVVEANKDSDKVQLVLAGASLSNATGPAIWVKTADKTFITTAEGTQNTLTSGSEFVLEEGEDEPDATVFSKDDLTLNGKGTLNITGDYKNGITCKDELVIGGGTLVVTAADHGIKGKDAVKMADGDVTVTAAGDGLKSTNDEDTSRGFVSIDGGTLTVNAGDDGVDAQWYFRIMGGTVNVIAADDAFHSESDGLIGGGDITVNAGDDAFHTEFELVIDDGTINVESCVEGYESQEVIVNGGYSNLVASDDAINAAVAEPYTGDAETTTADASAQGQRGTNQEDAGSAAPEGENRGNFSAPSEGQVADAAEGDTGMQRGRGQRPDMGDGESQGWGKGDGQRPQMPEGGFDEGEMPQMPEGGFDGEMPEAPQDGQLPDTSDGGQAPQGGFGGKGDMGGFGGGMGDVSEDCLIQINGGIVIVKGEGDGIDSNGNIEINGGALYVTGPTNSGNGAIDYELAATFNGGAVIAAGPAGMAAGFSGGSAPFAMANVSGNAGQTIAVVNGSGQVVASMTAQNPFQNVVIASGDLSEGDTVSIVVGGTISGAGEDGKGGTVSGGQSTEVTVSTTATQGAGGMGGMGGRGGMGPGGNTDGQTAPDGQEFEGRGGRGQGRDENATGQDGTAPTGPEGTTTV